MKESTNLFFFSFFLFYISISIVFFVFGIFEHINKIKQIANDKLSIFKSLFSFVNVLIYTFIV